MAGKSFPELKTSMSVGAVGASYGGFSVYWLAGHHEGRFDAFISHDGIFNFEAMYVETEEMFFLTENGKKFLKNIKPDDDSDGDGKILKDMF